MATNIFNMSDLWNNGSTIFHAIKMNVVNTFSAATSKLLQLETNGVHQFSVGPDGAVLVGSPAGGLKGPGTINSKGYYVDGVLVTVGAGTGNVIVSGTPTNGQLARWTDAFHIEGFTASYQPLDGDLTALAALGGTNTIYYRSGADTWSPVLIGSNLTFSGGTLSATATPVTAEYITASVDPVLANERVLTNTGTVTWDFSTPGQAKANAVGGGGGGAPTDAEYIVGALTTGLSAERLLTNTATISWDLTTPGQAKANAIIPAAGNVSNVGTPVDNQIAVWTAATTIEGHPSLIWTGSGLVIGNAATQNALSFVYGGAGANPTVSTVGVDTNIGWGRSTKGNASHNFYTGTFGNLQVSIAHQTGAGFLSFNGGDGVTNIQMLSGASGNRVTIGNASLTDGSIAVTQPAADNSTKIATTAFVKAQPSPSKLGFSARRAADLGGVADSVWTKVPMATMEFNDAGSGYDNTTNYRWVPPAGKAQMCASVYCAGTLPGTPLYVAIYKNGAIFRFATGASVSSNQAGAMLSIIDTANGTDYYEVFILGYTNTSITVYGTAPHGTFFMGSTL